MFLRKILFPFILSGFVIAVFFISTTLYYFNAVRVLENPVTIVVPQGSSVTKISHIMAEHEVIEFPRVFTLLLRVLAFNKSLKAGEYVFQDSVSPHMVYRKLVSGDVHVRSLTIAEGLTVQHVFDLLNANEALDGEITINVEEGYLLPETYYYHLGDLRDDLIKRMQDSLLEVLDTAWKKRVEGLPLKTKEDALILASIVEKETGIPEERKRVAAVFINRLKRGMQLQSDPTTIYAITRGKYVLERSLLLKDLEIQSPYNTYAIYGLPPTAIANPGKESIEAVLSPLNTNEYYFVADGTGGHKFAETLEDHNKNVAEWRKINKAK